MTQRDGEGVKPAGPAGIEWMNTQEAAAHLGITVRTLYRAIDEGKLVAYRMGRVIRIQKPDLDSFLEGSRIQPGELVHLYPEASDSAQPDNREAVDR